MKVVGRESVKRIRICLSKMTCSLIEAAAAYLDVHVVRSSLTSMIGRVRLKLPTYRTQEQNIKLLCPTNTSSYCSTHEEQEQESMMCVRRREVQE
jgi:hypothetical protein